MKLLELEKMTVTEKLADALTARGIFVEIVDGGLFFSQCNAQMDITAFKLFGVKLYLSTVLDLFNGEIITYTIDSRPTYSLVSEMLEKALERLREEHQLLIHC